MKDALFICNARYLLSLFDHYTSVIEHYQNLERLDPKLKHTCQEAITELVNQKKHILARVKKQTDYLKTELQNGK
ncbi:MAG: hypothetical protein EBX40_02130 [Gammaproteobacteria bacterium]|nr:hypothetical protein [Gammaproteobacteria bacterium]